MNVRPWLLSGLCALVVVGCGEPTYDIPPVDEAETKKAEEDYTKKMQEEMKKQGQPVPK